jgi:hypothetical protein
MKFADFIQAALFPFSMVVGLLYFTDINTFFTVAIATMLVQVNVNKFMLHKILEKMKDD